MEKYQLTIVLPGKTTPAKKKNISETIEKVVSLGKGKIVKVDDWGEIELAYKIKKNSAGVFLQFTLELEKSTIKMLSDKLKMEEGIIRYLLVSN